MSLDAATDALCVGLASGALMPSGLRLPPMLLDALGYRCTARFVAVFCPSVTNAVVIDDGGMGYPGRQHAYWLWMTHPYMTCFLPRRPRVGLRDGRHARWLIDRTAERLYLGETIAVRRIIGTQRTPMAPSAWSISARAAMGASRASSRERVLCAIEDTARVQRQLTAWLDDAWVGVMRAHPALVRVLAHLIGPKLSTENSVSAAARWRN